MIIIDNLNNRFGRKPLTQEELDTLFTKTVKPVYNISPDDAIIMLKDIFGITMSRTTLMRYENQKMIYKPMRGGGGPGGRWTKYSIDEVAEIYAAWSLVHGKYNIDQHRIGFSNEKLPCISPDTIAVIRDKFYHPLERRRDPFSTSPKETVYKRHTFVQIGDQICRWEVDDDGNMIYFPVTEPKQEDYLESDIKFFFYELVQSLWEYQYYFALNKLKT